MGLCASCREARPLFNDSVVKDQTRLSSHLLCIIQSAKLILKASGACNGREVLHGTPGRRHGISAREAADCLGNREPSTDDRCAERMPPAGRDPKTPLAQRYAERADGADSRSRSNFTARGNHMPPQVLSEPFRGVCSTLPEIFFNFFQETVILVPLNPHFAPRFAVKDALRKRLVLWSE